jgi:hypothetical protein
VEVALYAVVFGLAVAALARTAGTLFPAQGRWLFAALMVVPLFASQLNESVPSMPGVFDAWLDHLREAGIGA